MKYDLHVHTYKSSCSNLTPKKILKTAKKKGLNGIGIVDHNTMQGALEVKKANKNKKFEVVVGAEIKTEKGEVIGFYLNKEIKSRKFNEVIKEIKKQKGLVIIPHPFTYGIFRRGASKIPKNIDAIEAINGRCFFNSENRKALRFAAKNRIAKTAGSDAHFVSEIGKCYTIFEGSLRKALKQNKTKVYGKLGFSLFWRCLSVLEKIKDKFRCKNCKFDTNLLEK